jgi:diguanylate cyclase (GGDEF)-like protein
MLDGEGRNLMYAGRTAPAALLAALYAISGALCLVGASHPMSTETPVELLWALAAVGLVLGAAIWLLRASMRGGALHVLVGVLSLLIALLAWRSVTPVGVVGLGPVLLAVGLYAAHFFSLQLARLHVLLLVGLSSAGAWAARPDGFLVPWVVLVISTAALTDIQARLAAHLRTAAATDPLTGVANRRAWEAEAKRNLARAARSGEPLSFAILDLDDFKEVNDRQGHSAGDALRRDLTDGWTRRLRRADVLGRYGGDEFVLCLPATDHGGASEILERLAASHTFAWSGGVATAQAGDTLHSILARADADLYRQKRSGRHR